MSAQQLRAWPAQGGNPDWRVHLAHWVSRAQAAPAALWWAAAALLCVALLVSLQAVLQRSVEQGQLRLAITATQTSAARHCTTLLGSRAQEACLLALNETARRAAEANLSTARSSP
jgi:hypothetical protein